MYTLYNIKCTRWSLLLLVYSLFRSSICEIHKRKHDFERLSKEFASIQDSYLISSCALQYHLPILAVSIQSWRNRDMTVKCSQKAGAKEAWLQYYILSPYLLLVKTSLFFPQSGTQLLCELCLPWYTRSYHAYFSSSWTRSFKDGKLNLQAYEIHLPWCSLWSVFHQDSWFLLNSTETKSIKFFNTNESNFTEQPN